MRLMLFVLSAPVLLFACSAAGGSEPPAKSSPSEVPSSTASLDPGPIPADLFNQIVADAASRAAVDQSALTVVQSALVIWSDGSLGCPQPGMVYTQALVDGFHVILEANGTQYDYHGTGQRFVLCPPERAKPPVGDVR